LETEKPGAPGKKSKWIKEILLLLGMLALSAGIALLLTRFQDAYNVSLHSYGWLAYILVFLVSMLSSATIFVPAPCIAFVLAAATVWDPTLVAIAAGTGDAIGEMTSYWAGYVGEKLIVDEHLPAYQKAVSWMNKYGAWAIFGVALVPIVLFDLVGLAAGALKIRWWKFFLAAWCGKLPRAFLVAYLGHQIPLLVTPWFH
jgi:uncharacterized membrane protein YdjX (TVP38/TMEM64 family)